jgi:hypothetical protein
MPYHTKSAVLFIVFNRPDTTLKVFDAIKAARPARLYIAADGPRAGKPGEDVLCEQVRACTQLVDWPCEVKTLFRAQNLGCKDAVSSAISWFFEHEEEGVILEDDCLPANSFFSYCDILLEKYRHDTRIGHIGGANLQQGNIRGTASYYYSNLTHVWGWASWRRVWNRYDKELKAYHTDEVRQQLSKIFNDRLIIDNWETIFKELKAGAIDTWDYQLTFTNFFNNSLSVIPNQNLISNIGFGTGATHTQRSDSPYAFIPLQDTLTEIEHPVYVLPEKDADMHTLKFDFNWEATMRRYNKPTKRLKRFLKSAFSK